MPLTQVTLIFFVVIPKKNLLPLNIFFVVVLNLTWNKVDIYYVDLIMYISCEWKVLPTRARFIIKIMMHLNSWSLWLKKKKKSADSFYGFFLDFYLNIWQYICKHILDWWYSSIILLNQLLFEKKNYTWSSYIHNQNLIKP